MYFRNFNFKRSPFIKTRGITTLTGLNPTTTPLLIIIFPFVAGILTSCFLLGLQVLPSDGGGAMSDPNAPTPVNNTQELIEMLKPQLYDINMIRRNNMYVLRTAHDTLNIAVRDLHLNLDFVKNNHPDVHHMFVQYWDGLSAVRQEVARSIDMGFAESMHAMSRFQNEASHLDPMSALLMDILHTLDSAFDSGFDTGGEMILEAAKNMATRK